MSAKHDLIVDLAKRGMSREDIRRQARTTLAYIRAVLSRARALGESIPLLAGASVAGTPRRRSASRPLRQRIIPKRAAPPEARDAPDEPPSLNLTLMQLTDHTCKWAHGDGPFLFCGQLTKGNSVYCEHHHARAYERIAGR